MKIRRERVWHGVVWWSEVVRVEDLSGCMLAGRWKTQSEET